MNRPPIFLPGRPGSDEPDEPEGKPASLNDPTPTNQPPPTLFGGERSPIPNEAASIETQPTPASSIISPSDQPGNPPPPGTQANAGGPTSNTRPGPGAQQSSAPFYTSLRLIPNREQEMTVRALRRIDEIKREMGLAVDNRVLPKTWMDRRRVNDLSYNNDYTWRTALGGVFSRSNLSLHTNARHTRYLSAVVQRDLLGTDPFFGAMGWNSDNQELARQAEEYVQKEINSSNVRENLREAQKIALYRDECVVKVTWKEQSSPFKGPAKVLVDFRGNPVTTPELRIYIEEDSQFVPSPEAQGMAVLMEDPSFTIHQGDIVPEGQPLNPNQFTWRMIEDLPQKNTIYNNVSVAPIDWRCFLCPLRFSTIDEADICIHLYKASPNDLRAKYGDIDISQSYFGWWDNTGEKQAKLIQGELEEVPSIVLEEVTVAECYMRWDADGDGLDEEIFLVIDFQSKRPIFYDYLANHMDSRPFVVIPGLEKDTDRWYGRGIFSLGDDQELHMDTEFNRAQLRGARSSTITFRHKSAVKEWQAGLPTVFGGDQVYDIEDEKFGVERPPIFKLNMGEDNEKALELMEISRQSSDALLGAINSRDASQSDMNQSKTATGIVNLQQASDIMVNATEITQATAINKALWMAVKLVLKKMPKTVLSLSKDASKLVQLSKDKISSLEKDVRLFLTKSRSSQLYQSSQQAIEIAKDYRQLMINDPMGAKIARPVYISSLKSLEVPDPDDVLPEITDDMIQQWQQQQSSKGADSKPPFSIAAKLTDLSPSERNQALQRDGITPASPQELAAEDQRKAAQQAQQNGKRAT